VPARGALVWHPFSRTTVPANRPPGARAAADSGCGYGSGPLQRLVKRIT
jgi:hypothetical protein